ncbi:hypothetical protein DB345_13675 [Spartobacteria bacterium LR76]|nr:hypothetical protein DB345_13675 [Spartobacteria bacterium LR76]
MRHLSSRSSLKGFALVIVLGVIVLVVALIIGFLSRATTERAAASGFTASVNARQLGDMAVSIVQSQINDATTQGAKVAWTSQPGMIRTFDTQGKLVKAYKLYSADTMISSAFSPADDLPPADWASTPALWSDLNAPIVANNTKIFPILSPEALNADGQLGPVEGFSINSAPGVTSASYQKVPMPARWLYILKNGTVVVPTQSGSNVTVAGATTANPIVGRVAFWTDDETCKLNINTAGGGVDADDTYWDTPRAYTPKDVNSYALRQPVEGEFQRYPGHPGTVMLSAALPGLTLQDYMNLSPRLAFGGTEGATKKIEQATSLMTSPMKSDRLYSSVDELVFTPARTVRTNTLTSSAVEARKFFLTAQSRAPEINLFNLPRVAIWPVYDMSSSSWTQRTTAFDRLIAFCSSTGTGSKLLPYFFQRKNAYNPTTDISLQRNQDLYKYLQALTSEQIPGYGGKFSSKYGDDRDQILMEIFDYIRCTNLNDDNINKGSEYPNAYLNDQVKAGRYPGDRYTSGQLSRRDPNYSTAVPSQNNNISSSPWGMGRWPSPYEFLFVFSSCADASNPTSNDPTKNVMLSDSFELPGTALQPGEKRIQAAFLPQLFCVAAGWKQMFPQMRMYVEGLDSLKVNGQSLFYTGAKSYIDFVETPMGLGGGSGYGAMFIPTWAGQLKGVPYPTGPGAILESKERAYPLISHPITVSGNNLQFTGGKVTVKIFALTYPGRTETTSTPVQTIILDVPNGTFPMPKLSTNSAGWSWYSGGYDGWGDSNPQVGRMHTEQGGLTLFHNLKQTDSNVADVVRGLVIRSGDFRLTAGAPLIDDSSTTSPVFDKHPDWDTTKMVAALGVNMGAPDGTGTTTSAYADGGGPFVSGTSTTFQAGLGMGYPSMLTNATSDATSTGDFDTGTSIFPDGPYINKPDDGNNQRSAASIAVSDSGRQIPYFGSYNQGETDATFFSPNRIMPSAVMFGSLPTGVKARKPWQTLLFRPLAKAEAAHKGADAPADNLLLDLFWMPVVQPYALSDRFSTAGKINMNYQIMPFTYIERSTGMRAVLKSEKLTAIKNDQRDLHVSPWQPPKTIGTEIRNNLDIDETLKQFTERFADPTLISSGKNIFISPSEICNLYMVPKGQGQSASSMAAWWNGYRLTGDNLREKIYATIYPRLTTKSNTFTVHFRAQALAKATGTPADKWQEGRDIVAGEYRGSTTIERYINPDANIPDYASASSPSNVSQTLDSFYKWRTISNRQFTP